MQSPAIDLEQGLQNLSMDSAFLTSQGFDL